MTDRTPRSDIMSRSCQPRLRPALALVALMVVSTAAWLSDQPVDGQATKESHLPGVFDRVLSMHRAIVRGDLQALHSPAVWFAEHGSIRSPVGDMDGAERSLKLAAAGAAAATDVSRAAAAVAEMVVACGRCHRKLGVGPSLPSIASSRHTNIVGHMLRHEQAAEQMLHGLVMPSDSLWLQGTTAFAETPLRPAISRWTSNAARRWLESRQMSIGWRRTLLQRRILLHGPAPTLSCWARVPDATNGMPGRNASVCDRESPG
jgi:hypothetical protein